MAIEYFCCYHSYRRKLAKLSNEEVGRLFLALLEYSETGQKQELDGRESIAFDFIADDIDRAKENYQERCKANSENGKKGGRPRKQSVDEKPKKANGFSESEKSQSEYKSKSKPENKKELNDNISAPAQDPEFARAVNAFENKFGVLKQYNYDKLLFYVENMGADCCLRALDIAFSRGRDTANFGYTIGILKNKLSSGVHSIADWDKQDEDKRKPQEAPQTAPRIKTKPDYQPDWFNEFWNAYPRAMDITKAVDAWDMIRPDRETVDKMIDSIGWYKIVWKEPKYIPSPAKWLNEARWLDDVKGMITEDDIYM